MDCILEGKKKKKANEIQIIVLVLQKLFNGILWKIIFYLWGSSFLFLTYLILTREDRTQIS